MRKIVVTCLIFTAVLMAKSQNIEITSNHFEADEAKLVSKFTGNVKVVKGYDTITSDSLVINFDKNKNPIKYTATGKAKFKLILNKKHYAGHANKIIYNPAKKYYRFIGNAFLQDIDTHKKIYGDDIMIDQLNGKYDVKSSGNKPVKFIFKVDEKK